MSGITRRNLVKAGVASMVFPAAGVRAVEYSDSIKFDKVADVVVVGYGGAGACAAIEAHDKGAKVLILEKLAQGGGNTAVSAGGMMFPTDGDVKSAHTYLSATIDYAANEKDEVLLQKFCDSLEESKKFIEGLKPDTKMVCYGHAGFPKLPGADVIDKYRIRGKKRGGDMLFDQYRYAVEEVRKIEILYKTPGVELIRRGNEVLGVVAENEGKRFNIRANRGVVLAAGGFEYDKEMLMNFAQGRDIHGLGSPGNTGDGIRMAQSVGAKLWHMTGYACPCGMEVPGLVSCVQLNMRGPSHIWVDQTGKRFIDEKGVDNHAVLYAMNYFDPVLHTYPRIPFYLIFDEKARVSGPVSGGPTSGYAFNREGYTWSKDNSAEIESGILIKADTLPELAEKIKVPADNLVASVERWNKDIKAGADTQFGRILKRDMKAKAAYTGRELPIVSEPLDETGPYYAVKIYPTLFNTQGGPKKDVNGHVLDVQNKPIPRLYAAGEMGSLWGAIYQGATNNVESIVFGRAAGASAAAEKDWV